MSLKRITGGIVFPLTLLLMLLVTSLALPLTHTLAQQVELLKNPGFEGLNCPAEGWCSNNWTRDTFNGVPYGEIFTPQGWVTFWTEGVNPVDGRNFGRPECKVIPNAPPFVGPPARVRSGSYAIMQFGFFRAIDSGVYQVVSGLSPGATVQFSAYGHAWSCDKDSAQALSCGDSYQMLLRVGIDPNGGTDPWSPNVIWAGGYSYDQYRLIGPVQAQVGAGGVVTVFLRATAKWSYKHNDVYWDDASLVYVTPPTPPTNTPLPAPPTPTYGPSPTPRPTPTPRPDGATVHIVEPGDTLYGIALMYNVDVNQIRALNAGSIGPNDLIQVGQELVISLPAQTPTPLPPPPTATPEITPSSAPETGGGGTGAGEGASICVLAYHDRNKNTFRDDATNEELLPSAEITVADNSGAVARYLTDGVHEPHCFTSLAPGAYRVILKPPTNYAPSGYAEWSVAVAEGTTLEIQFGIVRSEQEEGTTTQESTQASTNEETAREGDSSTDGVFIIIARIGGIVLLLFAAALAVLFALSQRRV